jgi:hypothetical protein
MSGVEIGLRIEGVLGKLTWKKEPLAVGFAGAASGGRAEAKVHALGPRR